MLPREWIEERARELAAKRLTKDGAYSKEDALREVSGFGEHYLLYREHLSEATIDFIDRFVQIKRIDCPLE